jgi:hypothetical protein
MAGKLFLGIVISVALAVPAAADMTLLETLTVPSYQPDSTKAYAPPITSTVSLTTDQLYRFVASGTYDAGDTITADAEYSYRPVGEGTHVWQNPVENYGSYGEGLLDLMVDGDIVDWGPYTGSHIYTLDFTGLGDHVTFQINDFHPWNDVGDLSVQIYLVPLPAAVVIGMLGLGVAGLKLRKFV